MQRKKKCLKDTSKYSDLYSKVAQTKYISFGVCYYHVTEGKKYGLERLCGRDIIQVDRL